RCESKVRESPGAPARISLKLSQPTCRLRMISGVQRSAKISAPRAMGQYWPYVLMTQCSTAAFSCEVQIFDFTAAVRGGPMWPSRKEDTMNTPTIAEVPHRNEEATVVAIDGFRGRLISAK